LPESHIPETDLLLFKNPKFERHILQVYANLLEDAVHSRLTSRNNRTVVQFPTDVFTYVFGNVADLSVVGKEDFNKLPLSKYWYANLNVHGQSIQLNFPISVKSIVFYKTVHLPFTNTTVKKSLPVEKLVIVSSTAVCTADQLQL